MKAMPNVESAMRVVGVRDERGLMPLEEARRLVRGASAFERGSDEGGVTSADLLWAALLSLEDAAELAREAARIEWRFHPRGKDNTALVERYGDGVLAWIEGRVEDGVLANFPWCIGPSLLALECERAFELVWSLRGYDDTSEMQAWEVLPSREVSREELARAADGLREAWIRAHPQVALRRLAALAGRGDPRAREILVSRARAAPQRFASELADVVGAGVARALADELELASSLTEQAILDILDAAAERGDWPLFYYQVDGRLEYFGMRLIAARAREGDGWGVVFQRLEGSYPDALRIAQLAYGSEVGDPFVDGADIAQVTWEGAGFHGGVVSGWGEDLTLDEGMIDEEDLCFGRCVEIGYHPYRVAVIRAYLAKRPEWFPDAKDALSLLGLEDGEVIVDARAFRHVIGPNGREGSPEEPWEILPSEAATYRSLAAAIVARDAGRFTPGESNLDWRLHAHTDEPVKAPWTVARFGPPWAGAAMREAGVEGLSLTEAREILEGVTTFERGRGQREHGHYAQGSDRVFAALLSLADGAELAARGALEWTLPVRRSREEENTAIAERYGASSIPWMRHFIQDGVLTDLPGCLRACLLSIDDGAALAFLLELRGFSALDATGSPQAQLGVLIDAWLDASPSRAASLVRLALVEERAKGLLRTRALLHDLRSAVSEVTGDDALLDAIGVPKELSPEHVLARLDRAASGPPEDQDRWPRFFHGSYPGQAEYHAMRLFAAREEGGDGWRVILERVTGYGRTLRVMRYVYGAEDGHVASEDRGLELDIGDGEVKGPGGVVPFAPDPAPKLTERPDYWAAREAQHFIPPLRAYLAVHSPFAEHVLPASYRTIADTTSFAHVDGPSAPAGSEERAHHLLPSASSTYRSLAEAIVHRDPSRFDPGTPNTSSREHAVFATDE